MKKLFFSILSISLIIAFAVSTSGAFFRDDEKANGNTLVAGSLDLLVDSTSHYVGMVCQGSIAGGYIWVDEDTDPGNNARPELLGTECASTWASTNLDNQKFFNFSDIKPGDEGEDTVSLHVTDNPAWICAEVSNIVKNENGCSSPEALVDPTCEASASGELNDYLVLTSWRDNGSGDHSCNNIKDDDEAYIFENKNITDGIQWPIADSTYQGVPILDTCVGISWKVKEDAGNIIQTDSLSGDITFKAYQARHNEDFYCYKPKVTINKSVINDNGGTAGTSDFILKVGGVPYTYGELFEVIPGTYALTEDGPSGYTPIYGEDCDSLGNLTVAPNQNYSCTVTNDDNPSSLKIVKTVINDNGGTKQASDFGLKIDGNPASNNVATTVLPGTHTVSENILTGYTASSWGGDCNPDGTINISLGEDKTCTITNSDTGYTYNLPRQYSGSQGGNNWYYYAGSPASHILAGFDNTVDPWGTQTFSSWNSSSRYLEFTGRNPANWLNILPGNSSGWLQPGEYGYNNIPVAWRAPHAGTVYITGMLNTTSPDVGYYGSDDGVNLSIYKGTTLLAGPTLVFHGNTEAGRVASATLNTSTTVTAGQEIYFYADRRGWQDADGMYYSYTLTYSPTADRTAPVSTPTRISNMLIINASDSGTGGGPSSGVARIEYSRYSSPSLDWTQYPGVIFVNAGEKYQFRSIDNQGNVEPYQRLTI